ncbi:class I SAM-dependent methyltransferase [Bradyrhizobium sp.]|uniref:class I SAM-dependent methyltransferase n=1 Tax=Bradyrhizobium sp. TaxID=376 RepID=UPI003C756AA1
MSVANIVKAAVRTVVEKLVLRPVQFLLNNVSVNHDLAAEIRRQTSVECAQYIMQNARSALQFKLREELWDFTLPKIPQKGLILEFGVHRGYSLNYFAKRFPERMLFGFDSFEGLHVDWAGTGAAKSTFDLDGKLPSVRPNVSLVKGWFDQTLPPFLSQHEGDIALLHIDCDTYEATKIVLDLIPDRLTTGSVIIFDDYFGYRGWLIGEHKAWIEFAERNKVDYEYLGFTTERVSLVVRKVDAHATRPVLAQVSPGPIAG